MNEYLNFAKELAQESGKVMQRYFRAEDIGTTIKKDNTPLTIADTIINDLVIEKVKTKYPDHGVIGEEASFKNDASMFWVVDPIDGTIPFSLGMPFSSFSLGLVDKKDGQPLVGVIFDPFLDHLYSAVVEKGSYLNDTQIHTSKQETLLNSYVSICGSFKEDAKTGLYIGGGDYIEALSDKGAKYFSLLSQAYSAARVASGELIGSLFSYGSPWDSAAAALIVTEAGGVVTDLDGKIRRYDKFKKGCILSANQKIHQELLKAAKNAHNRH
jgi:fructose-1,6-bisphosphatase/inositol monophosphatase family enzyme